MKDVSRLALNFAALFLPFSPVTEDRLYNRLVLDARDYPHHITASDTTLQIYRKYSGTLLLGFDALLEGLG